MSLAMPEQERKQFLEQAHVGVLAVALAAGPPLAVPIWYAFRDGLVTVHTARGQRKTRALETAGSFALCAQDATPPYRYVSVAGPIVAIEPIPPDERRMMVHRYFTPDRAEAYLARTSASATDDVAVRMRPERWWASDFSRIDPA